MAAALRASWATYTSPWANNRDVYLNIDTVAGDFIAVWLSGDDTDSVVTYTYDGIAMTAVGEYSRGCDVFLCHYDPGTNVGTKQIHGNYNNGIRSFYCFAAAFSGVDHTNPVAGTAGGGSYYGHGGEEWTGNVGAHPILGYELCLLRGARTADDYLDYSTDAWTALSYGDAGYIDSTPTWGVKLWSRVPGPGDTSHSFHLCHTNTYNEGAAMISLNGAIGGAGPKIIVMAERWKQFLKDLKAGLVPPDLLRNRYRDLVAI